MTSGQAPLPAIGADEFLEELTRRVGLEAPTLGSRIDGDHLDLLQRFQLLRVVRDFSGPWPVELMRQLVTLDDVYEVVVTRQRNGAAAYGGETDTASLKPLVMSDLPFLFDLLGTGRGRTSLWRRRLRPNAWEFEQRLWEGVLHQSVVMLPSQQPAGLVSVFDADLPVGIAWLDVAVPLRIFFDLPQTLDAVAEFVDDVWSTWSIRKLYVDVPGPVLRHFQSGAGTAFAVEAHLREHEYVGGRSVDMIVAAIERPRGGDAHPIG